PIRTLELFLDRTVAEFFFNGGKSTCSTRLYPSSDFTRLTLRPANARDLGFHSIRSCLPFDSLFSGG
ncbi:MAG TPA: GH32 C-terminal domain-containing protein, partial [Thermotogota bacterium]|nr:GH32 C-terminal domain-containing protein [Thermotogota bacterium]HRW93872.1 GH32 C-terminal domain-containing protein [Thermotogota bacterium]